MAGYIGSKASVVSSGAERKKTFAITTTTTVLTGLSYSPTFVHLFHNGVRLVDGTDYTATDGTSITLTSAAESGDEVVVISYATFQAADAYTKAEADSEFVSDPNGAVTVDGSGNVGIGAAAPDAAITVAGDAHLKATTGYSSLYFNGVTDGSARYANIKKNFDSPFDLSVSASNSSNGAPLIFNSSSVLEAMRIDSSGNVLVGTTSSNVANQTGTTQGVRIAGADNIQVASTGVAAYFNKLSTDGDIVEFRRSGTKVGSLSVSNGNRLNINSGNVGLKLYSAGKQILPSNGANDNADNVVDLGSSGVRFDDIYATNGTIQTSDRNEKQDIDVLNAAETAVAQACKGLLRKFRWKDAVAEKGDDARIHFGIIAQDLQDAFAAQGLDAGNYAMFISSTWWEADRVIPAVEAVAEELDEDGNVIVEAVEAVAEQTVTDTFETLEEAPEGATERTRLGVRYPELLAFIIGAM